ncbi:unnamed protein product [Phytophthora fragariaefolia]|uniref:Unnamed protein product n=1 Tax=Phytophthora fragariaefolia TaxID=1490495 RepID=A0A9W6WRF3_9STRA|nr:unnamed protein product [Phytophthora fragariaefolia]
MPAKAFEDAADGCLSDEGGLVEVLEGYTRELGALCGGLEHQQLEDEGDEVNDEFEVGGDTVASLEEMTEECAALLTYFEGGRSVEVAGQEAPETLDVNSLDLKLDHEEYRPEELARDLDSFAVELHDFLSCLGNLSSDDPAPKQEETNECLQGLNCSKKKTVVETSSDSKTHEPGSSAGNTFSSHHAEVFSQRTKTAIAEHIMRLTLQKHRLINQDSTSELGLDTKHARTSGLKVSWSNFQSMSFQQHILRQKFARQRVRQIQEAEKRIESSRLRGAIDVSPRRPTKSERRKLDAQATYLGQLKVSPSPSSAFNPRYLCAVYLYGLRHLGTTFITFGSLAQLEQRARARFAINNVAGIYREMTELVLPENGIYPNKKCRLKRLHRISSLDHVSDGDTLCITQNAYEDMTILCDWIKRRQRVVHDFQFQSQRSPTVVSATISGELEPPKQKPSLNVASKAQLWDSNGRSIGVKTQPVLQ